MPQHSTPAALSSFRHRIVFDPPLPSCDGMVVVGLGPSWWVLSIPVLIILDLVAEAQGYWTMIAAVL